jgi:hypothetical protein
MTTEQPLNWNNKPYSDPAPQPPIDVSAAACAARAERHERQWRIVARVGWIAAALVAVWLHYAADFTRTESMVLIAVLLLVRVLYVLECRETHSSSSVDRI